ncbi:MAG: pseudouridine-5'-phosphate glycosidase, partial [Phycisphaerales bacterium]|nr:pseudouridine-5'-phosphate glycosidase [Phycisphaerales bacterium]
IPAVGGDEAWDPRSPTNLELARRLERAVRANGAVPATVAVLDGSIRIGLDDADLARLARDENAAKASTRDLAVVLATGRAAGTTVSATLCACRLTSPPIRVFATGGIGGVHRDWVTHPDVSTDLVELARTRCCVVSAGAKSILDLPATVECLETLGVPVIGYATDDFPRFHAVGTNELSTPLRLDTPRQIALACRHQWETLDLRSGLLVTNPVPIAAAVDGGAMDAQVRAADAASRAAGVRGRDRTPDVLARLAGASAGLLEANIALLVSNASLAALIATALAGG